MRETEAVGEARRQMEICNACRYCEGYCAVFPAMTLRREFSSGDLSYLANLCHGCKGCYHACQYAPPHAFGVNVPATFSALRQDSYEDYAWPKPMGTVFRRNGSVVALVSILAVVLVTLATMAWRDPAVFWGAHTGPGAFYRVIPWGLMAGIAGASFLFALVAMAIGVVNFWRDTGGGTARPAPLAEGAIDILTLANLSGGGHGCNDLDDRFTGAKRHLHHALFYGFALCFASTSVATVYDHFLGLQAPYAFWSLPVLLGTVGGIGMTVGATGLIWLKIVTDPAPVAKSVLGGEYAMLGLLWLVAVTGLVLLAARHTGAMGLLLVLHLGTVLAFFLLLPYSKMVHGAYRGAALVRNRMEKKRE